MSGGVVIAGGGLAAQRCAEELRRRGFDGRVRIVCAEAVAPYDRPPLSKAFLAGAAGAESLRLRDDAWYAANDVELLVGVRAEGVDVAARRLLLADGRALRWDHLVAATGAAARSLPALDGRDGVLTLRSAADALALREHLTAGARLVVVGGGFVGLEAAATAASLGAEVTVLEAGPEPLAGALGADAGRRVANLHRRRGVRVQTGVRIARVLGRRAVRGLELADGRRVGADAVLVAVGAAPDTRWLAAAGVPPDGVPADAGSATGVPGVLAAGDAARPRDPATGAPRRSEHWDAAARSGVAAARSVLGVPQRPTAPPFFWSDQHGVRIQLVGEPHGADRVTADGDAGADAFTATYWHDGRVVAVLLAGRPGELPAARRLVAGHAIDPERTAA